MRLTLLTLTALTLSIATAPGLARDNAPGKAYGAGGAGVAHCPPGLAKKSPACVPPGQAKKYGTGDHVDGEWVLVRDWDRYGLEPPRDGLGYYRLGDRLVLADRETREILDFIAAAARLLD